jgi:hypothetical protein
MLKRIGLCVCGVTTLQVSWLFGSFKHIAPDEANWLLFHAVLLAVGILAILVSLVPSSLVRKVRPEFTDEGRFSVLFLLGFAALGFAVTVTLGLVPVRLSPSVTTLYSVCPACIATATVDPSLAATICVLAPVNAAVLGL